MNRLKEKMLRGEALVGTMAWMKDPCICEIIGQLPYDFIWVEFEHSYLSLDHVLMHIIAAKDTPVIVRLPQHDYNAAKKVLEMGPDGVIFPMVGSAKEAMELMRFTLYPPRGTRGFGPMRALRYGESDAVTYVDGEKDTLCRFIQIERANLADELPELLENPYIDGFIFGPNDLSGSMGHVARSLTEDTQTLIRDMTAQIRAAGKIAGVAVGSADQALLDYYAAMGMTMITASADFSFVLDGARETQLRVRQALEKAGSR